MPDLTVDGELRRAKERFQQNNNDWKNKRELWDRLLERKEPVTLPPELTGSQEGLDYQTPDLEKTMFDHVDVLVMNPTLYDLETLDDSATARAKGRDILLWTARGWEKENEGRWWDRVVAEGQVRHGAKVMGLRWRPQTEPDLDYGDAEQAEENLTARSESAKRNPHPFYWIDTDLYGCYWLGDERREFGPDVLFYEYEIPYIDAQQRFSGEKSFSLSHAGKVVWLGEDEVNPEEFDGETIHVVVRDGKKLDGSICQLPGCTHPQRTIALFAFLEGQAIDDANMIDEVDSPFPGCSYFVIGGRVSSNRDPHKRFRPLMYAMLAEAAWINYLNTTLATMARTDYADEFFYINLANVPEWVRLPEGGDRMVVERPEPGSGEIPMYPGPVQRYPKEASQHLITLLDQANQRMASYKINRFLTGEAFTESSNATASAFKNQFQQAGLPYNALLAESDTAQHRSRRYEYHAIRWWGMTDPEDAKTRFHAVMSGGNARGVRTGKAAKPGEAIWVDADKLTLDFDLRILTESQTLAEQEQRWFIAKDQYLFGVLEPDDLIRAAGFDDIEGQKEKLRSFYIMQDAEPMIREMTLAAVQRRLSILTGIDFAQSGQGQAGAPPPDDVTQGRNPVQNTQNAMNTGQGPGNGL